MPSGAKKRKAAKKKKVNNSTISSATTTPNQSHHGESDGGELSSPASQDHHDQQHPFTEGEVVEVEKKGENASDDKSTRVGGEGQIDRVSKSEKSKGSSSSSSSSSDSDDESHVVEKKLLVLETVPVVDSFQPIETVSEKIMHKVDEVAVEIYPIVDPAETESVDSLTDVVVNGGSKIQEKIDLVVEEASSVAELDKSSVLEQTVLVNQSASTDNCVTSDIVAESVLKENGVKEAYSELKDHVVASTSQKLDGSSLLEQTVLVNESALKHNFSTSDVVVVSALKENGVKALPSLDEKPSSEPSDEVVASASTYPKESISRVNGTGDVIESETPDCSEREPLVASTPQAVKTTSWKSCCGILELFSGSDR